PTRTVADRLTLQRPGRTIEILHLGAGHTAGDLVVWLPKERIAISGDLVVWPVPLVGHPQSRVAEWGATLEKLLALDPKVIVPGHGPVLRDDSYPRRMIVLFATIVAQVRDAAGRGETLEQARKSVDLAAQRKTFAGDSKLRGFFFDRYVAGPAVESAYAAVQPASP
ncbi:MAG TPA: MBL fold metallo-hydrolase, partial [Thermoanaerobaculia bacterium]|nr:MBL fold metallo-hydrolase [Thermoanaerobaculia bacterium]